MKLPPDWLEKFQTYLYFGTLGAFAAMVGYLVQVAKNQGHAISLSMVGITVVVGFYLGMLFGVMVPVDWANRDVVVLLIGATGLKGFEIVTKTAKDLIPGMFKGGGTKD